MVIMDHEDPENHTPCATAGCPEAATLLGTLYDHDSVFRDVAYCPFCAGYLYRSFDITGAVR